MAFDIFYDPKMIS